LSGNLKQFSENCRGLLRTDVASMFAVVEIGSAFTAMMVVQDGRLVDASAGTNGPIGLRSRGAWDGEVAYWRCPLSKQDLFRGGLEDLGPLGPDAFRCIDNKPTKQRSTRQTSEET
jgi:predicted butyrate kinase (DUF1464 family)